MGRAWVARQFAPWLSTCAADEGRRALDALVVATDLYVWRLVRRDMGRSPAELRSLMKQMISAVLAELSPAHPSQEIVHARP